MRFDMGRDFYRATAMRLQGYVSEAAKRHPGVWKRVDALRADRGNGLPEWPDWCFLPMAGYMAVVTNGMSPQRFRNLDKDTLLDITQQVQVLAALAPWRTTQGIYVFHPELFTTIASTPLDGPLPVELFERLPEWCCYVPNVAESETLAPITWLGFFVYMEWDANTGRRELRCLVDYEKEDGSTGFAPFVLHIDRGTIEEAVRGFLDEVERQGMAHGVAGGPDAPDPADLKVLAAMTKPLVSLALYLCSVNAEIVHHKDPGRVPQRPKAKRTKKGERLFPPAAANTWEVGYRIGAALQRAREAGGAPRDPAGGESTARRSPAPHIRRAHWHSFWLGPREGPRELVVKWLPPIPVGVRDGEAAVPVIRLVR